MWSLLLHHIKSSSLGKQHVEYLQKYAPKIFFSGKKESVEAFAREENPELLHELWTECQVCNYLNYNYY